MNRHLGHQEEGQATQKHGWRRAIVPFAAAAVAAMALAASSVASFADQLSGSIDVAWVTNHKEPMDKLIAKFEAQNPGTKINITYQSVDAYWASIRTKMNSGTAPDVMFVWNGNGNPGAQLQFSPGGYLADLSNSPWISQVPASVAPNTMYQGKTYALPLVFEGIGLIANDDAIAKLGLSVPKTWPQLMSFCSAASAKGKIPFVLPAQTTQNVLHIAYSLAAGLVYGPDPNFNAEQAAGKVTFSSSPGWNQVFQKIADMQKAGCFGPDAAGTSVDTSIRQLGTGQALATFFANGALPSITASYSSLKLTVYPAPVDDNDASWLEAGVAACGAVNAKSKNPALAHAFLDFLAEPESDTLYADDVASLPVFPTKGYTPVPALANLWTAIQTHKDVPFLEQSWPNASVLNALQVGVQDIIGGRATPASVLKSMDDAYNQG